MKLMTYQLMIIESVKRTLSLEQMVKDYGDVSIPLIYSWRAETILYNCDLVQTDLSPHALFFFFLGS